MLERVDSADAEQVVDEAARARTADGAADAVVPYAAGDIGHREEVGGHPGLGDDVQLVVQAITGRLLGFSCAAARVASCRAVVAAGEGAEAAGVELVLFFTWGGAFWQVVSADAEVAEGVEGALVGEFGGRAEHPGDGVRLVRGAHGCADAFGDRDHVGLAGQVGAAVLRDEPGRAERDQVTRGVEHLRGPAVGRVQVPDGVGEHGGCSRFRGELRHPRGAERPAQIQVVHYLDDDIGGAVPPFFEELPGEVRTAGGDRLADVAVRAEQDDEALGVFGDHVARDDGCIFPSYGGVSSGHQAAQRRPAAAASREQRHPLRVLGRHWEAVDQGEVGAEQRPDPRVGTRLGVLERAVQAVPVGQREGGHAKSGRPRDQRRRARRAVAQRERRRHVQVGELGYRIGHRDQSATRRSVQVSAATSRRNS